MLYNRDSKTGEIMEYNNIRENLEQLKKNKMELNSIVQEIAQKRRDFETSLVPMREKFNDINNKTSQIGNRIVSVRLGDLLDEICWLSQTNVENLEISLCANISLDGVYSATEFLKYINYPEEYIINFRLSGGNKGVYAFNYVAALSMNFDSIQADGNTLFEHCSAVTKRRFNDVEYTELVVDKDIENIILNFTYNYLSLDTNASWRPADLFTQAVINCEERKANARADKIRAKIK